MEDNGKLEMFIDEVWEAACGDISDTATLPISSRTLRFHAAKNTQEHIQPFGLPDDRSLPLHVYVREEVYRRLEQEYGERPCLGRIDL